ncbi:hypothetical protein EW026_g854 [Hermanssonia centrifuga]|uniref:DUF6534 domain-containing protein n=1 Tax=Hermanssonia centrifuga TaxID=98765 RepID=A0A4S4KTV4_9APHY|nr:hypothetical protein EW026_g854 [Hermanssonia centrifuga]
MQVYLYFKVYPKDRPYLKGLVALVWGLDFMHTIMACIANWVNLIEHFGDTSQADHISWSIAVTVALTSTVSSLTEYMSALLALFRLVAALVSTGEMIRLANFQDFVIQYAWVFTMGLGAAVALDVFITFGLSYYLRQSKSGFSSMNEIIDSLVLYTVETGMATCVTTIVSLICWVAMPNNLIFLGLHFTISKLYANSFLATLNSRATLRARSQSSSDRSRDVSLPVLFSNSNRRIITAGRARHDDDPLSTRAMQISVEKTIQREIDGQITNIELNGEPSNADDDGSSDARSIKGGFSSSSGGAI